ncbi:DUF6779 domain-containing protein [Actinokineospora guangxiensis]|uniref:DUF6779 domain-containing protein n=1 Tax=Actinokineospora guangxiensis TaxID=1490288 RepID=A0ABW0ELI4_9PSEU
MTGRNDHIPRATGPRLLFLAALLLALGATAVLVLSDSLRWMRIGVVAALWAALAGAFLAVRYRRLSADRAEDAAQAQKIYELELEREVAARREFELSAEAATATAVKAAAEGGSRDDIAELRAELKAMREHLEVLLGGEVLVERIALHAEATRMRSRPEALESPVEPIRRIGEPTTDLIERVRGPWLEDTPGSRPIDPTWTPSWESGAWESGDLRRPARQGEQAVKAGRPAARPARAEARPGDARPARPAEEHPANGRPANARPADVRPARPADARPGAARPTGSAETPSPRREQDAGVSARLDVPQESRPRRPEAAHPAGPAGEAYGEQRVARSRTEADPARREPDAPPRQPARPRPEARAGEAARTRPEAREGAAPGEATAARLRPADPEATRSGVRPVEPHTQHGGRPLDRGAPPRVISRRTPEPAPPSAAEAARSRQAVDSSASPAATDSGVFAPAEVARPREGRAPAAGGRSASPPQASGAPGPAAAARPAAADSGTFAPVRAGRPTDTGTYPPAARADSPPPARLPAADPGDAARGGRAAETGTFAPARGQRATETGTHPPARPEQGQRAAEPAPPAKGKRAAETGTFPPAQPVRGKRAAETGTFPPAQPARGKRAAETGTFPPAQPVRGKRAAETGTYPPARPGSAAAAASAGRRAAESGTFPPVEEPAGRRRRPEAEQGGHASGTSVADLLAAHGGTAPRRRRRRDED